MNLLILDSLLLIAGISYYMVEALVFKTHTIAGLGVDLLFVILFAYRAMKKNTSIVVFAFPFLSLFGGIKFTVNKFFPASFNDLHIILVLLLAALLLTSNFVFFRPQRKIVKDRGKAGKQKDIPPFSIFVTKDMAITGPERFLHTQVIGSTGSGKTRYVFYPWAYQDIKNGAGVFIYDIKSNMREKIEGFVVDSNRDKDYYYFNLGDTNSMTYNPLTGDDPSEIANRVFSALYFDMQDGEQYYIDIAKRFLFSAIAVMKKKWPVITFKDLYIATSNPKLYLQPICNEMIDDINAKYLLEFVKKPDLDKNLLALLNKLAQFATSEWTKQINTTEPDIDIAKIISENKILLFQANSGIYQQEYKPLSILVMMHIQSEIAKRYTRPPKVPFFMYLDEFYNIIYQDFPETINKAREANVGLIFGHQSLGDLERYGQHIKKIILTNSRNKIIFNIEDPETAEYFSEAFGTRSIEKRINSFSTKEGTSQSGFTIREEEEFLVHPNDLKFLKLGEGYVKIETGEGRVISMVEYSDIPANIGRNRPLAANTRSAKPGKTTNYKITEVKDRPLRSLKDKLNFDKPGVKMSDVLIDAMEHNDNE